MWVIAGELASRGFLYWWIVRMLQMGPVSREMVLNFVAERTLGLPRSY